MSDKSDLFKILADLPSDAVVLSGSEGFTRTGSQLETQVRGLLDQLSDLPSGTRIATLLPDAPLTAVSLLALVHHVKVLPINPALSDPEITTVLRDANTQMLLSMAADTRAAQIAQECALPLATLDENATLALPKIDAKIAEPGLILLTSGSTGHPKRVPLSPHQLHLSASRIARALELSPQDRAVHALPMFHIGAIVDLLLAPLIAGGSIHFAGGMDSNAIHRAVMEHDGTWVQLVPTMLARLQADLSPQHATALGEKLRFIRSVSSDLAPNRQAVAEALFADTPIIQMYGMTETAGQITTNPMPPNIRKPGSVGRAYDVDLRIQDGEIQVGGSCVMLGYENVDNAEHFTLDGWLRTGDLGQIDKGGFLFLTGRSKDIINRGGEKIAPTEIEHAALRYPYVVEAAAFARPHETLGEEVGLAVTLSQGGTIADLKLALERELAAFKVPRRILVLDPLPRLGSGKIDRRALATLKSASEVDTPVRSNDLTAILVAQAWQKVLPDSTTETLGQTTDFFRCWRR